MNKHNIFLAVIAVSVIAGCSDSKSADAKLGALNNSKVVQVTFQQVIRQGATFCLEQRSMLKVQAMERANNPYVQMPGDCMVAAQPIQIEVHSQNNLGIASVYNNAGRALVQQKDLQTVQVRN